MHKTALGVCLAGAYVLLSIQIGTAQDPAAAQPKATPKKAAAKKAPGPVFTPTITAIFGAGQPGGGLVRGTADGLSAGDAVHAKVRDMLGNTVQDSPGSVDSSGKVVISFDQALIPGQIVRVFVSRKGTDIAVSDPVTVPPVQAAPAANDKPAEAPAQAPPATQLGATPPATAASAIRPPAVTMVNATTVAVTPPPAAPPPPPAVKQDAALQPERCDIAVEKPKYQAPELELKDDAKSIKIPSPFATGTAQVCIGSQAIVTTDNGNKNKVFPFTSSPFTVTLPDKLKSNQSVAVILKNDQGEAYVFRQDVLPGDPCAANPAPSGSTAPAITGLRQGDRAVTGTAPTGSGTVTVCVNGKPADLTSGKTVAYTDGKFEASLVVPVQSSKTPVRAVFVDDKNPRITADAAVLSSCNTLNSIFFSSSPKEGDTTIKGSGIPSTSDNKCSVSVLVNGDEVGLKDSQNKDIDSVNTDSAGNFGATLASALEVGQCVTIVQFESGTHPDRRAFEDLTCSSRLKEPARGREAPDDTSKDDASAVAIANEYVSSFLDLGRVRAYFAAGVVLANSGSSFSSQNLFLGFDLDRNWLWAGPVHDERRTSGLRFKRLMFNTYFEARLTAVPTAAAPTTPPASATPASVTPASATPASPTPASATPASATPASATPSATPSTIDTFVASRKAATLQGGVYMPILLTTWTRHHDIDGLSVGPIAKLGFETPVEAADTTVTALSSKSFYNFYGFGARLGTHRLSFSENVAPELLSYIDVLIGRFSGLDADPKIANPAAYQFGPGTDGHGLFLRYARPWRVNIEGTLKIPGYPFILGVNANIHQNFGFGNSHTVGNQPDDLRFFIGTRFDFGSLVSKLKTLK